MKTEIINSPKVSIVLPVFNGERFLKEAIESILSQTFTSWELIVVNDCSTDSTRDILRDFSNKDKRIIILDNSSNLKLPRSLNVGFRIARGNYFTWTSDDNLLKPNMLEVLVDELDNNEEYGMVYSDHEDINETGEYICTRELKEPCYMGIEGNVCGASFLYRKEVAVSVGEYDPMMFLAEDYDYWMRVYSVTEIKHVSQVLYSCRRHSKSLTATRTQQIAKQTLRAITKNIWGLLDKAEGIDGKLKLCKMIYSYLIIIYGRVSVNKAIRLINSYLYRLKIQNFISRIKKKL